MAGSEHTALEGSNALQHDAGHAGTTSKPKGVPLTHANLAASLHNIAATYELTDRDRSLLVMPLFHVHGLMAGMMQGILPITSALLVLPALHLVDLDFLMPKIERSPLEHSSVIFTYWHTDRSSWFKVH